MDMQYINGNNSWDKPILDLDPTSVSSCGVSPLGESFCVF